MKIFDPSTNTVTLTPDLVELLEVFTEYKGWSSVQQTATILLIKALRDQLTPEVIAEVTQGKVRTLVDNLTSPRLITTG